VSSRGRVRPNQTNISSPDSPGIRPCNNSGGVGANFETQTRQVDPMDNLPPSRGNRRTEIAGRPWPGLISRPRFSTWTGSSPTRPRRIRPRGSRRSTRTSKPGRCHASRSMSSPADYLAYVDGRPRYKGSRHSSSPGGSSSRAGRLMTNRAAKRSAAWATEKRAFNQIIEREGVKVFDSTIALVAKPPPRDQGRPGHLELQLRHPGEGPACNLFARSWMARIERRGLRGKPEPDIFAAAAADLRCPAQAIVIEDAVSGVRAG
jgi:hypothetical protein